MSNEFDDLLAAAEAGEDQSETVAGGDFVYELPVEGLTVGRLIEYIELGKHPQKPFQGKPKPDCEEVRVTFELLSPAKNIKEIEVNGEKRKVAEYITVKLTKKLGEKASFKSFFNKVTYGRPIKHLARCLGDAFTLTIVHNTVAGKDGNPDKKYANIRDGKTGEWFIGAPFAVDAITGAKTEYPVPANMNPLKIFLWDNPTKATWDALFIDGEREVKNGDQVTMVSKNWLQELILSAKDFPGSKLQLLLGGVKSSDLPMSEESVTVRTEEVRESLPADVAAKPAAANLDALAALGLG